MFHYVLRGHYILFYMKFVIGMHFYVFGSLHCSDNFYVWCKAAVGAEVQMLECQEMDKSSFLF